MKKDYTGPDGYENVYEDFGGKGLGKILSKDLSYKIDNLNVPITYCVKIEEILEGKYLGEFSELLNKDIVLKFSKLGGDFSILSERGKDSSLGLPKLKGDDKLLDNLKKIVLSNELEEGIKSVILDEMIQLPNDYLYLVIFDGDIIKIEISRNDMERLYYEIDIDGSIIQTESNSENITHEEIPNDVFGKLLDIHKQIFNYFGDISINTEGFYGNGEYIMIQVRPTPNETKIDYPKIEYINDIYKSSINTNFVYGIFDYEGFPEMINEENYLNPEKSIFILDENTRWFSPLIKDRLENNLPTILIDIYNGFNISHDPKLLPPHGNIRENFKYISYFGNDDIIENKVRVISNGDKGEILIYNNKEMSKDKFEARDIKKVCTFKYHNNNFEFPEEKVTSTGVITFTKESKIVVVEIDRGYDIPGGHVQKTDKSIIDAVKRESMEEAYVTLKDIELSTVVESDYFGSEPDKLTYMLFYTAFVDEMLDFIPNDESFSRTTMTKEEFIEIFKGDKELITNIVNNAYMQKINK